MGDGKYMDSIRHNFKNHSVRKSPDQIRTRRLIIEGKLIRIVRDFCQTDVDRAQKPVTEPLRLTFISFCGGNEFNISFTVINNRLHQRARRASLITSSAGRTFALPE